MISLCLGANIMRFSRGQLTGALLLLAVIWLTIAARMLCSGG